MLSSLSHKRDYGPILRLILMQAGNLNNGYRLKYFLLLKWQQVDSCSVNPLMPKSDL